MYVSSCVDGSDLMLCGNYIYHQYHDCQDMAYYLCADELNDVVVLPTANRALTPVLACKDRMIRILQVFNLLLLTFLSRHPSQNLFNMWQFASILSFATRSYLLTMIWRCHGLHDNDATRRLKPCSNKFLHFLTGAG